MVLKEIGCEHYSCKEMVKDHAMFLLAVLKVQSVLPDDNWTFK